MMSSDSIVTTSKNFSQQSLPQSIPNCSNTTKQSNIKSDKGKTSCSLIDTNPLDITSPLLHLTALELKQQVEEIKEVRRSVESLEKNLISAIVSMEQMDVVWPLKNANTNTFVKNANNVDMEGWNAKSR